MNKVDLDQNRESKYSNNQYNFKNVFSIPTTDQIFKFMEKDDIKSFLRALKRYINYIVNKLKN